MPSLSDLASLPVPPRQIRRRRGYFPLALRHLLLVFLLIFAYLFWQIGVGMVRILWFSTKVQATVTQVLVTPGERGPSYDLLVSYPFAGAVYSQKLSIGPRDVERFKEGDAVQVQVLPERPDRAQRYYENYPTLFVTVLGCLFMLGPTLGVAKMLWQLHVAPWKLRTLIREGAATSATIVDKKETPGRPPTSTLFYEYSAPSESVPGQGLSSSPVRASMKVPLEDFQEAQIGDRVVVLYRPERPRRSVIYRYTDYEFVSSAYGEGARASPARDYPANGNCLLIGLLASMLFAGIAWFLSWW
jgi:hypothetical protein